MCHFGFVKDEKKRVKNLLFQKPYKPIYHAFEPAEQGTGGRQLSDSDSRSPLQKMGGLRWIRTHATGQPACNTYNTEWCKHTLHLPKWGFSKCLVLMHTWRWIGQKRVQGLSLSVQLFGKGVKYIKSMKFVTVFQHLLCGRRFQFQWPLRDRIEML